MRNRSSKNHINYDSNDLIYNYSDDESYYDNLNIRDNNIND